ncbi:hypothetical protein [uncultured Faecalibaculum sp.]|uniref:hypothetical protein n=1 Tax=uncultured Faecalibaculum sp. TaxID=1729681 RepID=UPI0025E5AE68|nr:hypothetical protein [uncultured Faecalibaculum sp.]
MNIQQAMNELEAGHTLQSGHTLLKRRNDMILASSGTWTARIPLQDFEALWASCPFVLHAPASFIDEEADAQYYGKLRSRQ